MPGYDFQREARTAHSEAYSVEVDGDAAGRVDIHFPPSGEVLATLCVPPGFDDDAIEDLIAEIDERFVLSADPHRSDLIVTVWRGEHAGVYSEHDDDHPADNGHSPAP